VTELRTLTVTPEERELIASLLEQFADEADELATDIASDQDVLPVSGYDLEDVTEGLTALLACTNSVYVDRDRARLLMRTIRCLP
jgi:DNA replication initiation complex subunit (GINS family)